MSSDDNHWRAHMTRTARNICTCAVFATTSFNFWPSNLFCSDTTIVAEGHYMLFSIEEQSCLTVVCQMTCQRSHISWCVSWWHNVFVLLVQFALVHFVLLRQKLAYTPVFTVFKSNKMIKFRRRALLHEHMLIQIILHAKAKAWVFLDHFCSHFNAHGLSNRSKTWIRLKSNIHCQFFVSNIRKAVLNLRSVVKT